MNLQAWQKLIASYCLVHLSYY